MASDIITEAIVNITSDVVDSGCVAAEGSQEFKNWGVEQREIHEADATFCVTDVYGSP